MTSEYQVVYREADKLRHQFRDRVDAPNDPEARSLYNGLDQLAEQFEMQKSPRTLEQLAKRLEEEFRHVANQSTQIMDGRHLEDIRQGLEHIARQVRKFSNY